MGYGVVRKISGIEVKVSADAVRNFLSNLSSFVAKEADALKFA